MSRIKFPSEPHLGFDIHLDAYMALVQKLVNMTLNYKNVRVARLSFVDYENKDFYVDFPFNKELCIHNTSTVGKFGYGRYAGSFFDVILRLEDGNPMNLRIFYGIEEAVPPPQDEPKMYVLGEDRRFVKKGKATYIEYEGKYISLKDAKKLEKERKKSQVIS